MIEEFVLQIAKERLETIIEVYQAKFNKKELEEVIKIILEQV